MFTRHAISLRCKPPTPAPPARRFSCALWALFLIPLLFGGCNIKGGWLQYDSKILHADGRAQFETIKINQPENPASEATFTRKADGTVSSSVPPTYKPHNPSPASRALGWLVWLGGSACLLGCVLVVLRMSGWSFMAAAPKGVGYGLVAGGSLLIAVAVAFDARPVLSVAAVIAGVAVAVVVGYWDNLKQIVQRQKTLPETA